MTPSRFIGEADEAELRVLYKNVIRANGVAGLLQAVGEMARCVSIALDVIKESQ